MKAACNGHTDVVKMLVVAGSDLNKQDKVSALSYSIIVICTSVFYKIYSRVFLLARLYW